MKGLWLLGLLWATSGVSAAELKDADAAVKLAEQVMQKVSAGEIRAGRDLIKPYTIVPESELETWATKVEQMQPMAQARYGQPLGYELLRNDTIGTSLVRLVYLQRNEKHPLVWTFVFYRNDKGWTVNSFAFSDELTDI